LAFIYLIVVSRINSHVTRDFVREMFWAGEHTTL
jgi:hypothetical protein